MAIGKPRGRNGARPVYVYANVEVLRWLKKDPGNPPRGRKVYVGSEVGMKACRELERKKEAEFAAYRGTGEQLTASQYATRWLDVKHGVGTKRPSPNTEKLNRSMLRPFLAKFGDRRLDGIGRREALDWATGHSRSATTASAMLNDAVNDELIAANPLANRQQPQGRGRQDIHPITEDELDRLGHIALELWKGYGPTCRAWILFSAWVGCRPSETFSRRWTDLDFERGLVRVTRVKGRKQTEWIVFPEAAQEAVLAMGGTREGLVFRSIYGKPLNKGSYGYSWRPVRDAFQLGLSPQRRDELLLNEDGSYRDLDLYELRHMAASVMADRGLDEYAIATQLGNSPAVCRETYIHVYRDRQLDRVREALNARVVDLDEARKRRGA